MKVIIVQISTGNYISALNIRKTTPEKAHAQIFPSSASAKRAVNQGAYDESKCKFIEVEI